MNINDLNHTIESIYQLLESMKMLGMMNSMYRVNPIYGYVTTHVKKSIVIQEMVH